MSYGLTSEWTKRSNADEANGDSTGDLIPEDPKIIEQTSCTGANNLLIKSENTSYQSAETNFKVTSQTPAICETLHVHNSTVDKSMVKVEHNLEESICNNTLHVYQAISLEDLIKDEPDQEYELQSLEYAPIKPTPYQFLQALQVVRQFASMENYPDMEMLQMMTQDLQTFALRNGTNIKQY